MRHALLNSVVPDGELLFPPAGICISPWPLSQKLLGSIGVAATTMEHTPCAGGLQFHHWRGRRTLASFIGGAFTSGGDDERNQVQCECMEELRKEKNARSTEEDVNVQNASAAEISSLCSGTASSPTEKKYFFETTLKNDGLTGGTECVNHWGGAPENRGTTFSPGTVAVCRAGNFLGRCQMPECRTNGREELTAVTAGSTDRCANYVGSKFGECETKWVNDARLGPRMCRKKFPSESELSSMSHEKRMASKDGMCVLGAPCRL